MEGVIMGLEKLQHPLEREVPRLGPIDQSIEARINPSHEQYRDYKALEVIPVSVNRDLGGHKDTAPVRKQTLFIIPND
jgi:hypothetical protein